MTPEVFTYRDLVDHLIDVFDLQEDNVLLRRALRAVHTTVREVAHVHNWNYFRTEGLIRTDAPYSTGTITYDHTGGTNERELTLAVGTWPANAKFGNVVLSGVRYPVERRISDTVVILDENVNPGADVAAGTSYSWSRDTYQLPWDIVTPEQLFDATEQSAPTYLPASDIMAHDLFQNYTAGWPILYTILTGREPIGAKHIRFAPAPDEAREYPFMYTRRPSQLRTLELGASATASITVDTTTLTLAGEALTERQHKGAYIRLRSDANKPTGPYGGLQSDVHAYYPYEFGSRIASVTSGTVVELEDAATFTCASTGWTLSDPIDVEAGPMWTWLLRRLELEHQILSREVVETDRLEAQANRALTQAKERDRHNTAIRRRSGPQIVRTGRLVNDT